ncbi:choice-of-anchor A family protein [Haloglycomyces albus]|uniref:choice-of-anchor A family protein n=1 Tax=Haloglycomyces albus TaxID=526067 RepID=UPI001B7FE229|nr:choice-of-anchor A family protein [Haloglycomyces albus]
MDTESNHARTTRHLGWPFTYLVVASIVVAAVAAGMTLFAPSAGAAGLPGGLGPCLGDECPDTWPDPNNGTVSGYDENVNIFVGGDYDVRGSAAEAEGRIVTLGSFDLNKDPGGSSIYNVGIVGVGSRVPPPDESPYLIVGEDISTAPGQSIKAEEGDHWGEVLYGGTLDGEVEPEQSPRQDSAAVDPYRDLREQLEIASDCYAREDGDQRTATGDVVVTQPDRVMFSGDGTSELQVFNINEQLPNNAYIEYENIPENATVLINVFGDDVTIDTSQFAPSAIPFRQRTLWNFPDASSVNLTGTSQFEGSVLVGNPDSTTTVSVPGVNGRFYTAGSLTHTSSGMTGTELHSYPFDGDLPECDEIDPTPSPTEPTSAEDDPTHSPSPTDGPSPTDDPTTSPTDGPTTDQPSTATSSPSIPSDNDGLAVTGRSLVGAVGLAAVLGLTGVAVLYYTKRTRQQ